MAILFNLDLLDVDGSNVRGVLRTRRNVILHTYVAEWVDKDCGAVVPWFHSRSGQCAVSLNGTVRLNRL